MPVDYTLNFLSDLMGLLEEGLSSNVGAAWADDGNPAGCVSWTNIKKNLTAEAEGLLWPAGTYTWESLGVPEGAQVTAVELISWSERLASNTGLTSQTFLLRIRNNANTENVHGANSLLSVSPNTTVDATWQAGGAGTGSQAVTSGYQASNTPIRMELQYAVTCGNPTSSDWRADELLIRITYTGGAANNRVRMVISNL